MELSYKNKKLKDLFEDPVRLRRKYGGLTRKIDQRKEDLKAAENLEVLRSIPGARCHELTGEWNGCLAVNLSGNYRLIFKPDHNPVPRKEDGGLDWHSVTKIKIIEIIDYH